MGELFASVSDLFRPGGVQRRTPFTNGNALERRGGSRRLLQTSQNNLKRPENPTPADYAGMQDGVRIGKKPYLNLARIPGPGRRVQRHVNHHGRSDNVLSRDAAPEAAVEGIVTIVAHGQVTIRWNLVGVARHFDAG